MKLAAHLYVLDEGQYAPDDLAALLNRLAEVGYQGYEALPVNLGTYKPPPTGSSLEFCACHTVTAALQDLPQRTRYLREFNCRQVCNSGLLRWNDRTPEDYAETIAILNAAGRELARQGCRLHYHNHDFEFVPVKGEKTGMDLLLAGLDFEVVDLCLDVGWQWLAGNDPVRFMQQHAEKIGFLHLRDFDGKKSVELGRGQVPLRNIVQQIPHLPRVDWVVIEHDPGGPNPEETLRESYAHWKSLAG